MWKFVSRGIRDSIGRRACRTNIYSQSSQDPPEAKQSKIVKNCQYKRCIVQSFSSFYHGFYGKSRYLGAKDKQDKNKYDAKYTWTDAVGWSSILAFGYVLCQSLCVRRKLFEIDNRNFELWHKKLFIEPHIKVSRIVSQYFLPQPRYILPVSKAASNDDDDDDEVLLDKASTIEQPYGPITAEEALKEAIDEFVYAHETLMGELELDCGSKAIEEERYEDAFQHFTTGAELSSIPSMFNLGLCYELGLGTTIDYAKAVEYYKKAADNGHTDAMYNLGVFHAQGKGGLKVNLDTAKELFTQASKKGHNKASKALKLEKQIAMPPPKLGSDTKYHSISNVTKNNMVSNLINYNNYNFMVDCDEKNNEFANSYDECDNKKNPTDIFLDMLGASSAISVLSVGESVS